MCYTALYRPSTGDGRDGDGVQGIFSGADAGFLGEWANGLFLWILDGMGNLRGVCLFEMRIDRRGLISNYLDRQPLLDWALERLGPVLGS